jgi:diguanylate cyclase (GGDEF)-like protein/PAS domain S-box-containing protein
VIKALEARINPADVVARLSESSVLSTVMRGLLWINAEKQSYRVDTVGRILLETPAKSGSLADLNQLFKKEFAASQGPQATRTIAFATPGDRYLRMRALCANEGEQLYLVEDVTELVLNDITLKEQDRALRGLFKNSTHGMFRAMLSGEHTSANPALVEMMGCATEEDWLARSKDGLRGLYASPQRYDEFLKKLTENGKIVDHVSEIRDANGNAFWISATAWLVIGSDGTPTHFDGTVTDVSERMNMFAEVQKAAESDELTGLLNRTKLYDVIETKTNRTGECIPFAVVLIDLDRFKDINDVFGHATGDSVLLAVSDRLRQVVGDYGSVGRLGGDEFAAVIDFHGVGPSVEELANQMAAALRAPIDVKGIDHALSASIGVSTYPEHAQTRAELLRKADIALYKVKTTGRNGTCIFTSALEISRQRTHYLAQELREADKRGELELHYQPIVDAETARIEGFEALMRWNHPKRGTVAPGEFIPIAEDAGYMPAFGAWAIREACSHIVTLPQNLFVSVNVSAVQFNAVDFVDVVEFALIESGLEPSRLELEVTEGIVLRNEERTIEILDRLKKIGVSIALDDFGTGYSSFGYLQKFPFNKVKIDRSFVKNLADNRTNAALVRAVLSIGRDLGLPVVAEGVENAQQRDQLLQEGCPLFQGYLFGKPAPFSDVANSMALLNLGAAKRDDVTEAATALVETKLTA